VYKAFISYSHDDAAIASWLHRRLEKFRLPKRLAGTPANTSQNISRRPLRPVFRDEEELASSPSLGASIESALAQSENLIVICSPSAIASRWVEQEIISFQTINPHRPIFCCLVEGEPEDCIPSLLRPLEPLAADFRKTAERSTAFLRLVSGILGLRFDDLRRREQVANQRRLALVVAVSLCVTAMTSVSAVIALRAQKQAESQADIAKEVTNFLTGIFESSDPGVARGNEVSVRMLLDRAAAQIDSKLSRQPEVGAALLSTMGDVYSNLGHVDEAIKLYRQSLDAYARSVGDEDVDYAGAQRELGDLYYLAGQYDLAEELQSIALATHLEIGGDAGGELASDMNSLARTLTALGRKAEAERLYFASLELRDIENSTGTLETAETLVHLGWFYREQYKFAEAKPRIERALDIRRELLGDDHFLTIEVVDNLGNLYESTGEFELARNTYSQSLKIKRKVLPAGHRLIAQGQIDLASVASSLADYHKALELSTHGLELLEQKLGLNHPELDTALSIQRISFEGLGEFESAVTVLERILELYILNYGEQHELVGQALNNLGATLSEKLSRHGEAEPLLLRAVSILEAANSENHWRSIAHWTLANCQRELGMYVSSDSNYRLAISLYEADDDISAPDFPLYDALEADYVQLQSLRANPDQ